MGQDRVVMNKLGLTSVCGVLLVHSLACQNDGLGGGASEATSGHGGMTPNDTSAAVTRDALDTQADPVRDVGTGTSDDTAITDTPAPSSADPVSTTPSGTEPAATRLVQLSGAIQKGP